MTPCSSNKVFLVASCSLGLKLTAHEVSSLYDILDLFKSVLKRADAEWPIYGHQELNIEGLRPAPLCFDHFSLLEPELYTLKFSGQFPHSSAKTNTKA